MITAAGTLPSHPKPFVDTLRAELLKLVTLPDVHLTLLATFAVTFILDAAFIAAANDDQTGTTAALDVVLRSVGYAQAGFIVLGILAATSEYHGGQIRTTLTAVPRRVAVQIIKALGLALLTIPAAAAAVTASVLIARFAVADPATPAAGGQAVRTVAGATVYLVLTTLSAAAVATILRRSLPAVAGLLGYYFIAGPYVRGRAHFATYLPDTAGYGLWFPVGADAGSDLGTAQSYAVVLGWTVLAYALAVVSFSRRDA